MRVLDTDEQRIIRNKNLVEINEKLNRTKVKELDNTIKKLEKKLDVPKDVCYIFSAYVTRLDSDEVADKNSNTSNTMLSLGVIIFHFFIYRDQTTPK